MIMSNLPTIVITGISGQLGAFLSKLYVNKGYRVVGCVRHTANWNPWRLKLVDTLDKIILERIDLADQSSIDLVVQKYKPDYFVNAGAMSFVGSSWNIGAYTLDVTGTGTFRCLDAIKKFSPTTRFIQIGSSEIFGANADRVLDENSHFEPCSPYGIAKQASHASVISFRRYFNIFASNLISFNYTSPLQSNEFVCPKIIQNALRITDEYKRELPVQPFILGSIQGIRNWNSAEDTARAVDLILNHEEADDFCICSGEPVSVQTFCHKTFQLLGYNLIWHAGQQDLFAYAQYGCNEPWIESRKHLFRLSDVPYSTGDYSKAKRILGWQPTKNLEQIIQEMIDFELTGKFNINL